jgi:hypothetical protein
MMRLFRLYMLKREIAASLRARKQVRNARSEAARRGFSTEVRNRAKACRAMFGGV